MARTRRFYVCWALLMATLMMVSCRKRDTSRWYALEVKNDTGHELRDVEVVYPDGFKVTPYFLPVGGTGSVYPMMQAVPSSAVVRWSNPDGSHHEQKMSLSGILGNQDQSFDGNLTFTIRKDGAVTAAALPKFVIPKN